VQKINIFGFFIVDDLSKGRESGALSRFSGMRLFQRNDDKSVLTASKPGSDHRQGRFVVGQWYDTNSNVYCFFCVSRVC